MTSSRRGPFPRRGLTIVSVLLAVLLGSAPVLLAGPPQSQILISDDERLALGVDEGGAVNEVRVGTRSLPLLERAGGFSVRSAGGRPNLLDNPGFEVDDDGDGDPDDWTLTRGASLPELDRSVARSGKVSMRLTNRVQANSGVFWTEVPVSPNTHYFSCGWFRARALKPTAPTAYTPSRLSPFRLKIQQRSGEEELLQTSNAYGYTNNAGWNKQCVGFETKPEASSVRVLGQLVNGSGSGWLDDLYVGKLLGSSKAVRGEVTETPDGGAFEQTGSVRDEDLEMQATFAARSDHIRVDGVVSSTSRSDKAVEVTYTLPVDAGGWSWGDYARENRTIGDGTYSNETLWNVQPMNRYPFGAVHDDDSLLAFGTPLSRPRVTRIDYDGDRGLSISFDLGISRSASERGKASFSFVIYEADPGWGFRAATQKYYDIFPQSFVRRTDPAREGMWFQRPPLSQVEDSYRDFGMGLNVLALGRHSDQSHSTWGTTYLPWDNERGIYGTAYNHHWVYRGDPLPEDIPPYRAQIDKLKKDARSAATRYQRRRDRDEARAALRSTARDLNGRLYYEIYRTLPSFYESLDGLHRPNKDNDWETMVWKYQVRHARDLARGADARLDGIHLDSTSGMRRWGDIDNYERRHWGSTDIPLTFSYDSSRVAERLIFPIYAHIKKLSKWLHRRGMILSANFNASEARAGGWFGADRIDYFGIERSLTEKTSGDPFVSIDSFAMLKRTLAYQRPISTLDAPEDGETSVEELEEQLELNLFYGMFSGMGGGGHWEEERRAVYAEYTPLFRRLAAAGWEPVTDARSSNAEVWLERYGRIGNDNLHLTVRNQTSSPQPYDVTVDLSKSGDCEVTSVEATEEVEDLPIPVVVNDGEDTATFAAVIEPEKTQLIRLDVAGEGC